MWDEEEALECGGEHLRLGVEDEASGEEEYGGDEDVGGFCVEVYSAAEEGEWVEGHGHREEDLEHVLEGDVPDVVPSVCKGGDCDDEGGEVYEVREFLFSHDRGEEGEEVSECRGVYEEAL